MTIRDRIANATCTPAHAGGLICPACYERADEIMAACPEIAALDHASEGHLEVDSYGMWAVAGHGQIGDIGAAYDVLVIPKPESS